MSAVTLPSTPSRAGQWGILSGRLAAIALMLPPALVLFTLFVALPLLDAGYYSLFKWNGYGSPTDFVGLENFRQAFSHPIFWQAVRNTGVILAVSLFVQLPLALLLALLVHAKTPANTVFRLIFFLPYILAEVACGLIWSFVFDGNTGVAAVFFRAIGSQPVFILADPRFASWP